MYGEDGILLNNVTSCTGHACALYFHYKVVDALEEEVEEFYEDGIITKQGNKYECDIVMKCFGFTQSTSVYGN
jgi:NADH:ubiquinone oxidoreductase subunit E